MIIIKEFPQEKWPLYCPNDELIGYVNEYEFNDVRIQIKDQKLSGYYILFNNEKIFITSDGKTLTWPRGFFDLIYNQHSKLLGF